VRNTPYFFELSDVLTQFLAAFDSVLIQRYDQQRVPHEVIQVRYVNSPKQRVLFDIVNKAQNITLPVIAVNITHITRDSSRVFNKLDGFHLPSNHNMGPFSTKGYMGMPAPVDIGVSMSIITHYQRDMDQILSNFIPYANPYIVIAWPIPAAFGFSDTYEIRSNVLWDGTITQDYSIERDASNKGRLTADTSFTIKGWLFPAIPENPESTIFFINNNFYNTDFFTANKYTTTDDYSTLSGFTWTYPMSTGVVNELELAPLSAAPMVTNIEVLTEGGLEELYDNYSIPVSGTTISIIGKRFQYTSAVYLSSNVLDFYTNYTLSSAYKYYPQFSAYLLDSSAYTIASSNTLNVVIPELTVPGFFDIIIANDCGWDSTAHTGYHLYAG